MADGASVPAAIARRRPGSGCPPGRVDILNFIRLEFYSSFHFIRHSGASRNLGVGILNFIRHSGASRNLGVGILNFIRHSILFVIPAKAGIWDLLGD